eukprot:14184673-Heterocapsa_arctica.AAC.1
MAADWSMANVNILDGLGKEDKTPAAQEPLLVEPSVENMQRILLHSEVPQTRTCVPKKADGKQTKKEEIGEGCGSKTCIT